MKYIDVFVASPVEGPFTYKNSLQQKAVTGQRVMVDFAGRKQVGYVARTHDNKPSGFKIKAIVEIVDDEPIFDDRLLQLADHVARKYISFTGEAISMALPSGLNISKRFKVPFEDREPKQYTLTETQQKVYTDIIAHYNNNNYLNLVHGVTGSGKTEVYVDLAGHFIKQGKSVIFLVPEISLSSQIFERLYSVFKDDLVIYHSALTANQRLYNWKRFYGGDAKIVIGTRSAVFMQCPSLGLIVVDEEHDGSYKEHSSPRYNAKGVAFYRASTEGCAVVMGAATPSIESLYACEQGVINLHVLDKRFGNATFPTIEIVKVNGGREDIISPVLKVYTKRAIDDNRQVIFLLNRRGFAPLVLCNSCGTVSVCPDCNISLNYHNTGYMLCHYCGFKQSVPDKCEKCNSDDIKQVGSGTQRVEQAVQELYKRYTVARLDQDSSRKKGAVYDIITRMNKGEINILLGTQMVSKGFDFPNVTVVGILIADIGINLPDFRASERIFSLLMQVAGRSGRGKHQGHVIVQTLNDEYDIYTFLKNQDYMGFYRSELEIRRSLHYPPFARLARLLARGKNEQEVTTFIQKVKAKLEEEIRKNNVPVSMLGPSSAPIEKIAANYRHHIILKAKSVEVLRAIVSPVKKSLISRNVYLEIDIDPYDLM